MPAPFEGSAADRSLLRLESYPGRRRCLGQGVPLVINRGAEPHTFVKADKAFPSLQQRSSRRTEQVNKSSTQIRRLLTSAVAALLLSGFASLKDHTEVIREVRPADQSARELQDSIDPIPSRLDSTTQQ